MPSKKLSNVLRLNAISCLCFGTVFFTNPDATSLFLSGTAEYSKFLLFMGIGLFFNGIHLIAISLMNELPKKQIDYFIAGDIIWVVATIVLNVFSWLILTNEGRTASIVVAALVGVFAFFQIKFAKQVWPS